MGSKREIVAVVSLPCYGVECLFRFMGCDTDQQGMGNTTQKSIKRFYFTDSNRSLFGQRFNEWTRNHTAARRLEFNNVSSIVGGWMIVCSLLTIAGYLYGRN